MTRIEHRSLKTGGKDDWQTPRDLCNLIHRYAPIGLDPATSDENPTRARRFYTKADDGLSKPWDVVDQGEIVFFNCPYSETAKWLQKACEEVQGNPELEVVGLIGSRPGTRYWLNYVWTWATAVVFITGRLTFVGADDPAPFESALVYWGNRHREFMKNFNPIGHTVFV